MMVPSKEWAQGKIVVIDMHERVVGNGKHRSRKMQERERHQMKKKASLYLVSRSWCSLGRQVIRMFYMFKASSTPCDRFQCMKMPDACDPYILTITGDKITYPRRSQKIFLTFQR